jgi:hypothetical protein
LLNKMGTFWQCCVLFPCWNKSTNREDLLLTSRGYSFLYNSRALGPRIYSAQWVFCFSFFFLGSQTLLRPFSIRTFGIKAITKMTMSIMCCCTSQKPLQQGHSMQWLFFIPIV